jgi:S1-C subfamily serine protease
VSGAVFVDQNGQTWSKGTGFSIGGGSIITAFHVINGITNLSDIKIVWNQAEYVNNVTTIRQDVNHDFAVLKTTLNIPEIKVFSGETAPRGSKIGLVGFPLNENMPILHEGIVSSVRNENDGFFWYTINSFVNRGNSGGPVFLSDTGEIIGFVSSRQNDIIIIPNIDESKLTEGEKAIIFIVGQLAQNQQVGIGQIVGVNQRIVNNIKSQMLLS